MDSHTKKVMFSSKSVEWGTPQDVYDARNLMHSFELDVCATAENAKHSNYITPEMDAFKTRWTVDGTDSGEPADGVRPARCWMNPPYCRQELVCKNPATCQKKRCVKRGFHTTTYVPGLYQWVELAYQRSLAGCLVDCLLPGKTGSRWWNDFIWSNDNGRLREGVELHCIPGRLKFQGANDSAPFDSVLVTFLPHMINTR